MPSLTDYMKRWKLEKQGLSSGKKRKLSGEDSIRHNLDDSPAMRGAVIGGYIIGVVLISCEMWSLGIYGDGGGRRITEVFFLSLSLLAVFQLNHQKRFPKTRLLVLIFGGLCLQVFLNCLIITLVVSSTLPSYYALLCAPFTLVPLIHSVLLGRWLGVFSSVYMALFMSFLFPDQYASQASVVGISSALTVVFCTRRLKKRSQLLVAGFFSGLIALGVVWALQIIPFALPGKVLDTRRALLESGLILGVHCFCGLFVGGILPALESLFRVTTNMTWLELSDLNHKLLRRMQLEAPGTFHHSMVVASLSEAAAESIGANAPLCRVASYFHDIGKIEKPEYFIENQKEENPHDSLSPNMSALIIIAHVKDGVDLAVRNKLNQAVINVIKEHHGTSMVYYFYRKALEFQEGVASEDATSKKNEEGALTISEKGFRYPGPCPRTKESGIISLADSIESASRSMKKVTPQKIQSMIDDIVNNRIKDGQLNACPLTFQELNTIKETFASTLRSMLHTRVNYPKEGEALDTRDKATVKKG